EEEDEEEEEKREEPVAKENGLIPSSFSLLIIGIEDVNENEGGIEEGVAAGIEEEFLFSVVFILFSSSLINAGVGVVVVVVVEEIGRGLAKEKRTGEVSPFFLVSTPGSGDFSFLVSGD